MKLTFEQYVKVIEEELETSKIEAKDRRILDNVDSLQLVDFVLRLEDRLMLKETLVNDSTFSQRSPFSTIETLANYLLG
jgi:acyl carrier protein